jgi:hypothetical protein
VQRRTNQGHLFVEDEYKHKTLIRTEPTIREKFDAAHCQSSTKSMLYQSWNLVSPVVIRVYTAHEIKPELVCMSVNCYAQGDKEPTGSFRVSESLEDD